MAEKVVKPHKEVGLGGAVLIMLMILAIMVLGKLFMNFDTGMLCLIVALATTCVFVFVYGFTWDYMFKEGVIPMVARASGAILILLSFIRFRNPDTYLLVVHYDNDPKVGDSVEHTIRQYARFSRLRSKTETRGGVEATYEIRVSNRSSIAGEMMDIAGVTDATLVACQNETGA